MVLATAQIAGTGAAGATPSRPYGSGFYGAGVYPGTKLYEDTTLTPAPTVVLGSMASTAVSNPFTPPPNSLVVVAVNIGFLAAVPGAPAVSVADSAGNSYLPNTGIYDGVTDGAYFFSFAYGPQTQTITLTVTRSVTSQALIQIAPRIIIGAANNQAGSGTAVVPSGSAAVSVVQSTTLQLTASLTTATVTLPSPTTSGNSLVATVLSNGNTANPVVTGLTLGGSADHWASVVKADPTVSYGGEIWYDANCASGQTVVTVTCAGGAGGSAGIWLAVYEVTGIIAADQASANADGTGTATTWTSGTTSTTSRTNEIAFGIMRGRTPVVVTGDGTFTLQNLVEAYTGYQTFNSTRTATFTGSQTAFVYVAAVATFAGAATGGVSSTAVSGSITTNRAGSMVYTTATVGNQEATFAPVGGTLALGTASSISDTEAAAVGRLPGLAPVATTYTAGWNVPTSAPFAWAALEIFGPVADVNTNIAGAGTVKVTAAVGSVILPTANIAGTGVAGALPVISVSASVRGAGVASAPTSGTIQFAPATLLSGVGEADQVVPTVGALGTAQGAGTALAVPVESGVGTAQGAGAAIAVATVGALAAAAGAGQIVIAPPAAGQVQGTGAVTAVPTLPAGPGTARGAGSAVAIPTVSAAGVLAAGAGAAKALPTFRLAAHLSGTGVAQIAVGSVSPVGTATGAGALIALPTIRISAALIAAGGLMATPVGALSTDDTIEPGPCTLAMSIGPTSTRAPVNVGGTGAGGSTVGGSTPAMAVGTTVSDRGN